VKRSITAVATFSMFDVEHCLEIALVPESGAPVKDESITPDVGCSLVAAGVVLRRNQDQARARFHGARLLLRLLLCLRPRAPAECMQDANDCRISGENANSNGRDHRDAKNERHEERNQDQSPCKNFST
jgi:hypothetical protein